MTSSLTTGYNRPLFILPFDHRASFEKGLYHTDEASMTGEQREGIIEEKEIIYAGFKKAVLEKVPKDQAAILVDEEFGAGILTDALKNGFKTCVATEKSGKEEFDLEYGTNFKEHIEKFKPTFVKALVRFNPDNDSEVNKKQIEKLKILSDYCHEQNHLFMLEVLVLPTEKQLEKVGNDLLQYEESIRPMLTAEAIDDFYTFEVNPDVWKLEGMNHKKDYEAVVERIKARGSQAGIVVLGRGEKREMVEKWIAEGARVEGVTGFAVGRTVFWQPVLDFKEKRLTKAEAIDIISKNYQFFYTLFLENRVL
jgi:myo-inositol catabolism protein IolC